MFDYIDGAAEDEVTLRRSIAGFADYEFVPRVLRDVSLIDTSTTLLGKPISFPFVVAPTGFTRIAHSQGELAVAQASERTGIPYCLSTMGTRSIEEVAQVNHASKWFQVYVWKDRGLVRELLERSAAAGYEAICITVDLARLGRRERDIRRGFTLPPKIGLDTIFDTVRRPSWTVDFLRGGPIVFANLTTRHKRSEAGADTSYSSAAGTEAVDLARFVAAQLDSSLNWDDIAWFREIWKGPIVIKGIQCTDDARIAAELGIDAVALSNHGGRQLEGSPAPIRLLPRVAEALQGDTELILDGGVRRGSDIIKALALGATTTMGGRAGFYGLGAAGPAGVETAFGFLRSELELSMALCGLTSIADIGPETIEYIR